MDVRLPDGTVLKNVPDGTTKEQIANKLRSSGRTVPDSWMSKAASQPDVAERGAMTPEQRKQADVESMAKFGRGVVEEGKEIVGGIAKIPGAVSQAVKDPSGTASSLLSKAAGVAGTVGSAIAHPQQTAEAGIKAIREFDVGSAGRLAADVAVGGVAGKALGEAGQIAKGVVSGARGGAEAAAEAARVKELDRVLPEEARRHKVAAAEFGLPPSDDMMTQIGSDLESTVRTGARQKLHGIAAERKAVTDPKWEAYRKRAAALEEQGYYFVVDKAGKDLIEDLNIMEVGGPGLETIYTDAEKAAAGKLRKALSGLDKGDERVMPVTLDVVDKELRNLRALQFDNAQEGYSKVVHDRYRNLYDRVNTALEQWVGKENYPRAHYAAASKEYDKWGSKLGRALTGEQDMDYLGKEGVPPQEFQGKVARKLFSTSETVKEGIGLLGYNQMREYAGRFVSNNLRYKKAASAMKWLEDNQWVKQFPDMDEATAGYVRSLATREADAATLDRWKTYAKRAGLIGAASAAAGVGVYGASRIAGH
jgi:hypothetical protein